VPSGTAIIVIAGAVIIVAAGTAISVFACTAIIVSTGTATIEAAGTAFSVVAGIGMDNHHCSWWVHLALPASTIIVLASCICPFTVPVLRMFCGSEAIRYLNPKKSLLSNGLSQNMPAESVPGTGIKQIIRIHNTAESNQNLF
jgi:hypothetical protein